MKKLLIFLTAVLMLAASAFSLTACNDGSVNSQPDNSQGTPAVPENSGEEAPDISEDNSVLVVYFSWSGAGNTERMANYIAERTSSPFGKAK